MSDLHEAYEAVFGQAAEARAARPYEGIVLRVVPDVWMVDLRQKAALRGLDQRVTNALRSPIESTVRIGNLVVAAEQGWIPPEAA